MSLKYKLLCFETRFILIKLFWVLTETNILEVLLHRTHEVLLYFHALEFRQSSQNDTEQRGLDVNFL